MPAEPGSVTMVKDWAGGYCASFVVEVEGPQPEPSVKAVGVDLGVAALAVTSNGEKIAPPKFLRSALKRLGRLQRALSRTDKASRKRAKSRFRVAKCHAKVADKRLDFLHKLSTRLIGENKR